MKEPFLEAAGIEWLRYTKRTAECRARIIKHDLLHHKKATHP